MSEVTEAIRTAPPKGERRLEDLPGPRGLPLLGNLLQLDIEHAHTIMEKWADRHGSRASFEKRFRAPRPQSAGHHGCRSQRRDDSLH